MLNSMIKKVLLELHDTFCDRINSILHLVNTFDEPGSSFQTLSQISLAGGIFCSSSLKKIEIIVHAVFIIFDKSRVKCIYFKE